MNGFYSECIAEIGSMTQAMKAQRVLAEAAIPTTVIKSNSSKNAKGCAYGVSFACAQEENVQNALLKAGVKVRRWKNES
ncbi:MAG: DUF3343 domain-containing protein [Ruminococcaceae bacterium]|nr:DUF3343 domain-containing protein [Oscillospiraceae bacterium]